MKYFPTMFPPLKPDTEFRCYLIRLLRFALLYRKHYERRLRAPNERIIEGKTWRIISVLAPLPRIPAVRARPPFTALFSRPRGIIDKATSNPSEVE